MSQSIRRRCLEHNPPLIDPFVERSMSSGGKSYGLGPASYDVRQDQRLAVPPRGFVLGWTLERFWLPRDLAATVRDKSSWARVGLALQNTHLDPGWYGRLRLEISNNVQEEFVIAGGEPIAQIVFELLDFPTEQPYDGRYQNQERGSELVLKPIDELELSVRTVNCLRAAGITTVGELVGKTESGLPRLLGRRSLKEIQQTLATMGLHLGMT